MREYRVQKTHVGYFLPQRRAWWGGWAYVLNEPATMHHDATCEARSTLDEALADCERDARRRQAPPAPETVWRGLL